MRIFIDGDGSPVKEDVIKLGESYGLDVIIVTSVDHYTTKEYANIGTLLEQRYHSGKLRKAGIRTKGPKPFTEKDHMSFRQALKKAIDQGLPSTEDSR